MASPDFIKNALAAALGPEKAKELNAAMSSQTDDMGLDALRYIDPIMIANYIRTEHPQTIALIISYLTDIDQAATVLRSLPENLQADVVYRIASLDSIPPGVVNELNEVLTDEMKQAGSMVTKVGGVAPVAEILNAIDKASETRILSTIEESNPDLAEQIRELMFTFEDLVMLEVSDLQKILRDVDMGRLAIALKTASDRLRTLLRSCLSKRAAETVAEELEYAGRVKLSEVEEAQLEIIGIVREMEANGEIDLTSLRGGGSATG